MAINEGGAVTPHADLNFSAGAKLQFGESLEKTNKLPANISCKTGNENFWLNEVFIPTAYILIFVVGVIGNGLVVWLMVKKDRRGFSGYQRSVTNLYVFNLAIADLIFVGFLPFWTAYSLSENNWYFGDAGCKLLTFITCLNLYGSVFFLVGMAIDRYFAIVLAVKAHNYRTRKNAIIACAVIWILASLVASQAFALRKSSRVSKDQCPEQYYCHWNFYENEGVTIVYFVVRTSLGFVLPLLVILFCYIVIFISLKRRNKRTANSGMKIPEQKITRLIMWVIGMFVVCWLPNHVVNVYYAIVSFSYKGSNGFPIENVFAVTSCFGYANSSCNPILYAFMKEDIRSQLASLAGKYFGYRTSSFAPGVVSEASSPRFTELNSWKKSTRKSEKSKSKSSDCLSPAATPQIKLDDLSGESSNVFNLEEAKQTVDDSIYDPKPALATPSGTILAEDETNVETALL